MEVIEVIGSYFRLVGNFYLSILILIRYVGVGFQVSNARHQDLKQDRLMIDDV